MALAHAETLVVPSTVAAPVWVTAPFDVTLRFWPMLEVPSTVAVLLVSCTLLAPLFDRLTAPVRVFDAFVSVISLAPAEQLVAPTTVAAAGCVVPPPAAV